MGKPAARVGDMTAHGGTIVAPGAPTVLIGKMPAATLTSMHVCPMLTGPVPHVGGPVILGSTGVLLGKMPAARVGDMAVCVGPPDTIVLGCFTVLIGEVGSGSQAGSAGSAAAAASAKTIPAKSVSPFPLAPIPPPTDKLHLCDFKFVDSAKKPLTGIPFLLTDPAKIKLKGASHSEGCRYGGYAQAGSYTVEVKQLSNAKWPSDKITMGEKINLTVDADGFEEGEEGVIVLIERTNGGGQNIFEHIPFKVSGKKVNVKWKVDLTHLAPTPVPAPGTAPVTKTFHFLAYGMGAMAVSGPVSIDSKLKITQQDVLGRPLKNRKVQVTFCDGTMREMQLDDNGEADFGVIPAGPIRVQLVEEENALPADDEAGPYLETKTVLRKGCRDEEGEKRIKKQGKIRIKGTQVFDLQKDLLELGFDAVGNADGDFGEGTKGAVKAFQEAAKTGARKQSDKDVTVTAGYKGTVNGAVDEATKAEIKEWKAKGYQLCAKILPLDQKAKEKIVSITAKIESGPKAYSAMNLDCEFEGDFDLPHGWKKQKVNGKSRSQPDSQQDKIRQSKYFDTPEHVGLSFGLIQFTQQSWLGELLGRMKAANAIKFKEIFGEHSNELLRVLQSKGSAELFEEEVFDRQNNSMGVKKVKRLPPVRPVDGKDIWISPWKERFDAAGGEESFQRCQDQLAIEEFLDKIISYAKSISLNPISEKSLSLLFDRKVQEGNVKKYLDGLKKAKDEKKYWESLTTGKESDIKNRITRIMKNSSVKWETLYQL